MEISLGWCIIIEFEFQIWHEGQMDLLLYNCFSWRFRNSCKANILKMTIEIQTCFSRISLGFAILNHICCAHIKFQPVSHLYNLSDIGQVLGLEMKTFKSYFCHFLQLDLAWQRKPIDVRAVINTMLRYASRCERDLCAQCCLWTLHFT